MTALLGASETLDLLLTIEGVHSGLASFTDLYLEYYRLVGVAWDHFDLTTVVLYEEAYQTNPSLHLPPRLHHHLDPASEAGRALGGQLAADLTEARSPEAAAGSAGSAPQDPAPAGGVSYSAALWGALGCVALGAALAQFAPGCLALAF